MILDIFGRLFDILLKNRRAQIADESDITLIRKRHIFHNKIPDLDTVRNHYGESFIQLQAIFNKFDPIKNTKLIDNPNKYQLLTRTVIYKLHKQKTKQQVADLLFLEFSLWFKHEYNLYKQKEDLAEEVFSFKKNKIHSNPFSETTSN